MSDAPASAGALLDEAPSRSETVVARRVREESVLVPILRQGTDVGSVYGLNAVGSAIWELLDGRTTGHEIVDVLVERFEVDRSRAVRDYEAFVARLEALGFVERASR